MITYGDAMPRDTGTPIAGANTVTRLGCPFVTGCRPVRSVAFHAIGANKASVTIRCQSVVVPRMGL